MEPLWIIGLTLVTLATPFLRKSFFLVGGEEKGTAPAPSGRRLFPDALKGLAIAAVVLIHVAYFYLPEHDSEKEKFLFWINDLARFAVPFFLILSGMLLDPEATLEKGWLDFWRKKLLRIFLPYLLVASAILVRRGATAEEFVGGIITGNFLPPFYFIIVLFELYLIYPLLVLFRGREWFLPAAFALSLAAYLFSFITFIGEYLTFFEYLFFFAYGIWGRERFLRLDFSREMKEIWSWGFYLAVFMIFAYLFPEHYYNNQYFYAPALFRLLLFFEGKKGRIIRTLAAFGRVSLWVYLIHFPLIEALQERIIRLGGGFQFGFWLTFGVALLSSAALAFLLDKLYSPLVAWAYRRR